LYIILLSWTFSKLFARFVHIYFVAKKYNFSFLDPNIVEGEGGYFSIVIQLISMIVYTWKLPGNYLTWSKHVLDRCARANKLLGFVKRYSGEISDVRTRQSLYLSLVRSVFGYSNDQNQNDQILQWQPNLLPSGQMQNHNLYQRSFFIRATRTWNSLPTTLRSPDINIRQFKTDLQTYYLKALRECCFNGEDPRT
jgi:hypothetical protein